MKSFLLFNERIKVRNSQKGDLLKNKRKLLNLQLFNKIHNLNSKISNAPTCENSPIYENYNYYCDSLEDKNGFNINKFKDISNYTVKGILKSSSTINDKIITKHQWSNNIEKNKIFLIIS